MKTMFYSAALFACFLFVLLIYAHAQAAGGQQTAFISIPGPLSGCPTPTAGQDSLCDVSGVGWEESVSGAAYVPLAQPAAAAGVTSFNGRTGAVTSQTGDYNCAQVGCPAPAPVLSVNGKTGAVVISAASTTTTTLQ